MVRPYAGAAGTHVFVGLLSMAAGVAWVCLFQFYDLLKPEGKSFWEIFPPWLTVLLSAKIICGFWFFVTGTVGCCIQRRGCNEGVFVALNVLNVIIWAPALMLIMAALIFGFIFGIEFIAAILNSNEEAEELINLFNDLAWLWALPAIGLFCGFVEFILSIVSYSIVCCCRPNSLDDGYDYQYEMK